MNGNEDYYDLFCQNHGDDSEEMFEHSAFEERVASSPFRDDFYFYDDDLNISSPTPLSKEGTMRQPVYARNIEHSSSQSLVSKPEHRTVRDHLSPSWNSHFRQPDLASDLGSNRNVISQSQNTRQFDPRNSHGIRLCPVSDLPDVYRGLFKFGVFNAVQSKCFNDVITGDRNIVISAPTGSGKTVLFELGIIRMLERSKLSGKQVKCVYIAPTKALCSERFSDWTTKFEPIGIKCCELTGDTVVFGQNAWGDANNATIIVTTVEELNDILSSQYALILTILQCEKWDSLTRNWHDHDQILSQIKLFLVDEVHILNESRGSTLEVVVSRMKLRGSSIRFILVSATVPNIDDVAFWVGASDGDSEPAQIFEFGDEYRPCQLTKHVVGIPRKTGQNDFQFAKNLDYRIFSVLQQYSVGKPILIFCATRKGVFGTADQLMKEFTENESGKSKLPWSRPTKINHSFSDKRLDAFASVGIGIHHAGLTLDDRRATERLYLNKTLRVLIATSTLAVGVNLPAHMVVIKGVTTYQNNLTKEYSDLEIVQMLGRAGRPQFDKDGTAIILCESELEQKYSAIVHGKTVLESSLHVNLSEHLNSEIGLGTITDVETAKKWLRTSFLFRRILKNPEHYALDCTSSTGGGTSNTSVDDIVMSSITQLKATNLINYVEHGAERGKLSTTQYGEIMSKYYIRRGTMDVILGIDKLSTVRQILESICDAEEFQEMKLRASEKGVYNKLRNDPDIRFAIKKIEKTTDKVFLLVQAVLGGVNLNEYKSAESQPPLEALIVFKHIARIARAALDVAVVKKSGSMIKYGLEIFRCLSAKAWEDRPIVLRQLDHIGEKSIKASHQHKGFGTHLKKKLQVLAEHGIASIPTLRKQSPLRIEALLNRKPPFGLDVLACLSELPQYVLSISEVRVETDGGKGPVQIDLRVECALSENKNVLGGPKAKKQRSKHNQMTAVLTVTSDLELIDFRRIPTKALKSGKSFEVVAELTKPSQTVVVIVTPETIAGISVQHIYKPNVSPKEYPVLDTRPLTLVEMDLVGLEEDPDFWNMDLDSSSAVAHDINESEPIPTKQVKRETVANIEDLTKIRHDGKYECNHPCKDKSRCRHLCCREGLSEAPHTRRKQQGVQETAPTTVVPNTMKKVTRLHSPARTLQPKQPRKDNSLEVLDSMHKRSQVAQHLNLAAGERIKLDSSQTIKRKRNPSLANYEVSLATLDDAASAPTVEVPEQLSDSDDDMPATISFGEKVVKFSDQKNKARATVASPRISPYKPSTLDERLFLSDSDESVEIIEPVKKKARTGKENIYSAEPKTPPPPPAQETRKTTEFVKQKPEITKETETPHSPDDDEFAELDAWLQSGCVDIV